MGPGIPVAGRGRDMISIAQRWLLRRRSISDERLLHLFWKRAELKRDYARLLRERDRLIALLRQQEGATLQQQQRFEELERWMADPLKAANAALYFQLKGLWHSANRRLAELGSEMVTRQLEEEGFEERSRFEDHRGAALAAIHQRLDSLRERQLALQAREESLRSRREGLGGFWNVLRRRAVDAELAGVQAAGLALLPQVERYRRAELEKREEQPSRTEILSVEGRRFVNLSLIALAQELVVHFEDHGMAAMARQAALCNVREVEYGGIDDCRMLSQRLEHAMRRFQAREAPEQALTRRTTWLQRHAEFRDPAATLPATGSLDRIPCTLTGDDPWPADAREIGANVVADDYWGVCRILHG